MTPVIPWALLLLAAAVRADPPAAEAAAARDQARQCLERSRESAVEACRRALELGLAPSRAATVRRALARELIALDRGAEAVAVYREAARVQPEDGEAQLRLGQALLSISGDAEAAVPVLQRASALTPDEARAHGALGLALSAAGRLPEALAAFDTALRLDAEFLESRPGARQVYEAARRGERWPRPAITPSPPPP